MSTFYERYAGRRKDLRSLLCIGLDPQPEFLPKPLNSNHTDWITFFRAVIESTIDLTIAYKPNIAFFEAIPNGSVLLAEVIRIIRERDPGVLVIGDAKRGDIKNSMAAYARACFEIFDFDAATVNPLQGLETIEPFIRFREKSTMVLCLTSNPGAAEYFMHGTPPLFERIAADVAQLNGEVGNLWLVIGATKSGADMQKIRSIAPDVPLLIPGVGAQGGNVKDVLEITGRDVLINSSRSILYGARHKKEIEEKSRSAALEIIEQMRSSLQEL